jgi:hypothetical protein
LAGQRYERAIEVDERLQCAIGPVLVQAQRAAPE